MKLFVSSEYCTLCLLTLLFPCSAGIIFARTRTRSTGWVKFVNDETKATIRKKPKNADLVPGCIWVIAIMVPRDVALNGFVESWETVGKPAEALVSDDTNVALVKVLEHPHICKTLVAILSTNILIND